MTSMPLSRTEVEKVEVPPGNEDWLTIAQVCRILKISHTTLHRLRSQGHIKDTFPLGRPPKGARGGFMVRIARSEVERFMRTGLAQRRTQPRSDDDG